MTPDGAVIELGRGEPSELERRIRAVPRPSPVLDRAQARSLTERQLEILEQLGEMFDGGFADLTMAEIASRSHCSLRTLYGLASSRNELVLIVVDRNLWRVGRHAMDAIDPSMAALEAVQAYLEAANEIVNATSAAFSRDLAALPAAQRLADRHTDYVVAAVRAMLDLAVEEGECPSIDTYAIARALSIVARDLSSPSMAASLACTPKQGADQLLGLVLHGMRSQAADEERHARGERSAR